VWFPAGLRTWAAAVRLPYQVSIARISSESWYSSRRRSATSGNDSSSWGPDRFCGVARHLQSGVVGLRGVWEGKARVQHEQPVR